MICKWICVWKKICLEEKEIAVKTKAEAPAIYAEKKLMIPSDACDPTTYDSDANAKCNMIRPWHTRFLYHHQFFFFCTSLFAHLRTLHLNKQTYERERKKVRAIDTTTIHLLKLNVCIYIPIWYRSVRFCTCTLAIDLLWWNSKTLKYHEWW